MKHSSETTNVTHKHSWSSWNVWILWNKVEIVLFVKARQKGLTSSLRGQPVNTKHLYNICTSSAQRIRRRSDIEQMLYKCFVFTGNGGPETPPWHINHGNPSLVIYLWASERCKSRKSGSVTRPVIPLGGAQRIRPSDTRVKIRDRDAAR